MTKAKTMKKVIAIFLIIQMLFSIMLPAAVLSADALNPTIDLSGGRPESTNENSWDYSNNAYTVTDNVTLIGDMVKDRHIVIKAGSSKGGSASNPIVVTLKGANVITKSENANPAIKLEQGTHAILSLIGMSTVISYHNDYPGIDVFVK